MAGAMKGSFVTLSTMKDPFITRAPQRAGHPPTERGKQPASLGPDTEQSLSNSKGGIGQPRRAPNQSRLAHAVADLDATGARKVQIRRHKRI